MTIAVFTLSLLGAMAMQPPVRDMCSSHTLLTV